MQRQMTRIELRDLIGNGQNSVVEFKSDPVDGLSFARDVAAFANSHGGRILIGVDDHGHVSGIGDGPTRKPRHESRVQALGRLEDWVAAICRDDLRPALVPRVEIVSEVAPGRDVAVVTIDRGWTVYCLSQEPQRHCYVRTGRVSREADFEELAARLPQQGAFRLELRPVSGTSLADLDRRRLLDYFVRVRERKAPSDGPFWPDAPEEAWEALLMNTLMLREEAPGSATVAGLMLFGKSPGRFLPHTKIEAVAYHGTQRDEAVGEELSLQGPLVPLCDEDGSLLEPGLVENAIDFVGRNDVAGGPALGARTSGPRFPLDAVREAILNAIVHRDYQVTDSIKLAVYADRLEIVSPGRLLNEVTVERMRAGYRRARNELLRDVMRDYGYMKHIGMGVPREIVRVMRDHNGTEPDLVAGTDRFTVRFRRQSALQAA